MHQPSGPSAEPQDLMVHPHDFSDAMWMRTLDVAYRAACAATRGDKAYADDIAATIIEKMLVNDRPIQERGVPNYVRTAVMHHIIDDVRKAKAAYRGGGTNPVDNEELVALENAGAVRNHNLGANPADLLVASEVEQAMRNAHDDLLARLEARNRRLVELYLDGRTHADIAQELGYRSEAVAKTTLHRTLCHLRKCCPQEYRGLLLDVRGN